MITVRKSLERGRADHGWLQSFHSFSFADYHDPKHMGFGNLRVINEDYIATGTGFGMHGHRDMEIVTYVLQGALAHRDSMGNGARIVPGDVQRMSAGRGVMHSEHNDDAGVTHLLQIWIQPRQRGIEPGYEQKHFDDADKRGRLRVVVSEDGREGSLRMSADAAIYAGLIDGAEAIEHVLVPSRKAYLQVVRGRVAANGNVLEAGDAALLSDERSLRLGDGKDAEVLLFDLAV